MIEKVFSSVHTLSNRGEMTWIPQKASAFGRTAESAGFLWYPCHLSSVAQGVDGGKHLFDHHFLPAPGRAGREGGRVSCRRVLLARPGEGGRSDPGRFRLA